MKIALSVILMLIGFSAVAQKLPTVQTASMLAPANIKIDGKASEWDDKFQAYNNHVEFFYTLSNDKDNLYLTVQVLEKSVIRHIMNGGINLIVNKTGKKNDKDGMGITYPVFDHNIMFAPEYYVANGLRRGSSGMSSGGGGSSSSGGAPINRNNFVKIDGISFGIPDGPTPGQGQPSPAQADSLMKANNTSFGNKAKNIRLAGFKDLDSLISVYNEDGIKATGAFDSKGIYTYEMAIPLKYIGMNAGNQDKFTYHLMINSVDQKGVTIIYGTGADGMQKATGVKTEPGMQMAQPATDFWGEYTFSQKIADMKTTAAILPFLIFAGFAAKAQKLPSVQTASVLAPANIKIDGKATEWDNKFQAFNNHVEFYYTLSNDDNNLYLTVQAATKSVVRHIINGGISLIVNKTGKKDDKTGMAITYPLFETNNKFTPRLSGINGAGSGFKTVTIREGNSVLTYSAGEDTPNGKPTAPPTPAETDSITRANNTNFSTKAKNIGLKGFKDLDSLISVYNQDGIKAAGTFDNKGLFTYELAMPLKCLGLDANAASKFSYHMVINEVPQQGIELYSGTGPGGSSGVKMGPGAQMGEEATDFWGEYTLAKK